MNNTMIDAIIVIMLIYIFLGSIKELIKDILKLFPENDAINLFIDVFLN